MLSIFGGSIVIDSEYIQRVNSKHSVVYFLSVMATNGVYRIIKYTSPNNKTNTPIRIGETVKFAHDGYIIAAAQVTKIIVTSKSTEIQLSCIEKNNSPLLSIEDANQILDNCINIGFEWTSEKYNGLIYK